MPNCCKLAATVKRRQDHRKQGERADERTDCHEGERADVLHPYALSHKGGAPDQGGKQKQQVALHLILLPHGSTCSSAR